MNPRELKICSRVRRFREQLKWSQKAFAHHIGIKRDQLQSIEYCRTPLRYDVAWIIASLFGRALEWFVGYDLPPQGRTRFIMPLPRATGLPKNALLSEVFERFAGSIDDETIRENEKKTAHLVEIDSDDAQARGLVTMLLKANLESWIARLPPHTASAFSDAMIQFAEGYLKGLPEQPPEIVKAMHAVLLEEGRSARAVAGHAEEKLPQNKMQASLDNEGRFPDTTGVRSHIRNLKDLIARLKKLTAPRGAKSALAREFGVSRQAVDQWLSGESSPSADIAIRLLHWKPKPTK